MDFKKVAELLDAQEWTFAKTMPNNPHWYTVRKRWPNDQDFVDVVEHMREFGYKGMWWKREYTYFDCNGWSYWTMGESINKDGAPWTIIINRKPTREVAENKGGYDGIAAAYDAKFSDPVYKSEDLLFISMLPEMKGRILDVGCGSGFLPDSLEIDPANYLGIDPSQGMLDLFKQKHQGFRLLNCKLESFWHGKYDTIISMYGSMGYVDPKHYGRIPDLLAPGGKYFLMLFNDDYEVVTHKELGIELPIYKNGGHVPEFGFCKHIGNYLICTNYEI